MRSYVEYITRSKAKHGPRFSETELDRRFRSFYETGQRIKVETCGMVLTGTVGVTTGWRPCFLLMRTSRSLGSPWTLGPQDKILAVQRGRVYRTMS